MRTPEVINPRSSFGAGWQALLRGASAENGSTAGEVDGGPICDQALQIWCRARYMGWMADKLKKPLTDAQLKARSLSRWENEGGAQGRDGQFATRNRNRTSKMAVDIMPDEGAQAD